MPSFISVNGEWKAAKEKAVNIKTGEIYEGPDREATDIIKTETGGLGESIGMKSEEDPQIMEVARQHGLTVEQWMSRNKPSDAQLKAQAAAQTKVVTHQPESPKPQAAKSKGGFVDGDKDFVQDFNKKG